MMCSNRVLGNSRLIVAAAVSSWINSDHFQSTRRGGPTSTSSDSGYDAQTFSPWHRGDISSNEEEIAPPSSQPETEVQKRPSLAARTRHLYRDEDEENYVNLQDTNKSPSDPDGDSTEQGREREVIPTQQIQVESRPSITVRREIVNVLQKGAEEDDSKPLATCRYPHLCTLVQLSSGFCLFVFVLLLLPLSLHPLPLSEKAFSR